MGNDNEQRLRAYRDLGLVIPDDNYVVIDSRSFAPSPIAILDLNVRELRVYSPYQHRELLSRRVLTEEEIAELLTVFKSDDYRNLPANTEKVGFDLVEVAITSGIEGIENHIWHVLPEHPVVLRILDLHQKLTTESTES